ncbi:hypothetical protein [Rhizobium leguminosarum]|uniref:hypothetical protein n=1 Tax=Rhizobium leguminosarum TaxID=384 RepID=UPI0021BBCA36|nr:hypothetical protein [Rhizobium leguminosarum]
MRIQAALIFAMVAFSSSNVIGQTKEQPSADSERCTASPADQNNQSATEEAGKAAETVRFRKRWTIATVY